MFHFVWYWLSTARWRELKGVWFAKRYNTVTFGLLTNFFLHFFALRTFLTFRVARQAESFTMSLATAASCRAGRPLSPFKPLTILWMKWWKNKIDDEKLRRKILTFTLNGARYFILYDHFPVNFPTIGSIFKAFSSASLKGVILTTISLTFSPTSPWSIDFLIFLGATQTIFVVFTFLTIIQTFAIYSIAR